MRLNNRVLVDNHYLIFWHRLCCHKLPQPRTPRHRHLSQILAWTLFHPLAPSIWCPTSAVICEKCHESSTSSTALICRLAFLLGIEL